MMKNINYLDHPYWIPKCLNVGRISIPLQIFSYIYFPQIFTEIKMFGCLKMWKFPLTTMLFSYFDYFTIFWYCRICPNPLMFLQGDNVKACNSSLITQLKNLTWKLHRIPYPRGIALQFYWVFLSSLLR